MLGVIDVEKDGIVSIVSWVMSFDSDNTVVWDTVTDDTLFFDRDRFDRGFAFALGLGAASRCEIRKLNLMSPPRNVQ